MNGKIWVVAVCALSVSLTATLNGCAGMPNQKIWIPYKKAIEDPRFRKFDLRTEIAAQARFLIKSRKSGFNQEQSRYFRLGFAGYDMAYDFSSFRSGAYRTVRDVYDTAYGQIVIQEDSMYFNNEIELLFPYALNQLCLANSTQRNAVLSDGFFDFDFSTPKGQSFGFRIPEKAARDYIAYISAGSYSDSSAADLAGRIVDAMEIR